MNNVSGITEVSAAVHAGAEVGRASCPPAVRGASNETLACVPPTGLLIDSGQRAGVVRVCKSNVCLQISVPIQQKSIFFLSILQFQVEVKPE